MRDGNMNDNIISDVIGSIRYGLWNKLSIWGNALIVAVGVLLLLLGGTVYPLLYVWQLLTLLQFIAILITFVFGGLFCVIYFGINLVKMKKGKALLRRCLEEGDLQRSSAQVLVTTASGYRHPAVITLRFKVNGKKYEKRNLNIQYAEKYYYIDILYSSKYDEVFLLKMN